MMSELERADLRRTWRKETEGALQDTEAEIAAFNLGTHIWEKLCGCLWPGEGYRKTLLAQRKVLRRELGLESSDE